MQGALSCQRTHPFCCSRVLPYKEEKKMVSGKVFLLLKENPRETTEEVEQAEGALGHSR